MLIRMRRLLILPPRRSRPMRRNTTLRIPLPRTLPNRRRVW